MPEELVPWESRYARSQLIKVSISINIRYLIWRNEDEDV